MNSRFLNSTYSDKTITSILEESINNLKYKLTFIDHRTNQERELSKGELSAIRDAGLRGASTEIQIEAPSSRMRGGGWAGERMEIVSFGRRQQVGYADIRTDESYFNQIRKQFGDGDKNQNSSSDICIAPLSPKEKDDRKQKISTLSLEQRSKLIKQRGFDIYCELEIKYRAKFNKEVVAELMQQEEKPLYEALELDLPPIGSYLKHTRKLVKSKERSMS